MLPLGGYSMLERIRSGEIPIIFGGGDGRSPERAIQIEGARNHVEGVNAEYCWFAKLEQEEGAAVEVDSQALTEINGRQYDWFNVTVAGEKREYYFATDAFWGLQSEGSEASGGESPANDTPGVDPNAFAAQLSQMILGGETPSSPSVEDLSDFLSSVTTKFEDIEDDSVCGYEIDLHPEPDPPDGAPSLEAILAELDALVGLDAVKQRVRSLVNRIALVRRRKAAGQVPTPISLHMAFVGPPGTGKTTVARLVGQLYRVLGLLPSGHLVETDRSGLVAGYVGQTALKTKEAVEKAAGGVLFVDEAYALARRGETQSDYGLEAIDTLVKQMEDRRHELAVVLAGYSSEMETFLGSNPGLRSRVGHVIEFPGFSPEELCQILERQLTEHGLALSPGARSKAAAYLADRHRRRDRSFGNAREVRALVDSIHGRLANRLAEYLDVSGDALNAILARDVPRPESDEEDESLECVLEELDALVGLEPVKEHVRSLVAYQQARIKRLAAGLPAPAISLHSVYVGNPGTGKTTVARLYARVLRALRLVRRGHLIEVDRAGLVAQFMGQTAPRVLEAVERSVGGVLFIDEAYSLVGSGNSPDPYGEEAIATLLKVVEDQRDELAVVLAGYPGPMAQFIASNPGLQSRFQRVIEFPDYSTGELLEIFAGFARAASLKLGAGVREHIQAYLEHTPDSGLGNGRLARNLFEEVLMTQSRRIAAAPENQPAALDEIRLEDMPGVPSRRREPGSGQYI